VAGGVLSTLAVAGASSPANAATTVTDTAELPTLTGGLSTQVARTAEVTRQAADGYATQALRDAAIAKALKEAEKDQASAERKAKAKKEAAEEAARRAAAAASRSNERTTLASTDVSVPSGSVGTVLSFLRAQVGDAYVSGGTGPNSWDCSGLVQAAFRQVGVDLPRTSQDQSTAGTAVPVSSAQPGDILYWGGAGSAYHVGVYLGGGKYLAAANPSKGVVIEDLSGYPASGAVRVL
jgi:cell wall-associated NlpC family hydrolase